MKKIAVFASGTGSNFQAIVEAVQSGNLHVELSLLVCDRPNAAVIQKAESAGVPVFVFQPKTFASKADFEQVILDEMNKRQIEFIVLAGYMRLIGPVLLEAYGGRCINLHPSLLPAFPGKDAIAQALEAGVSQTGVTIHYVDEGMDTGPIIAQREIAIEAGESLEALTERVHRIEHEFYPETLEKLLNRDGNQMEGTRS